MQAQHTIATGFTASEDHMNSVLENNKVTVLDMSYCPYCQATKRTLAQNGVSAYVITLDQLPGGDASKQWCNTQFKHRTYPKVFFGKEFIGGNDALQAVVNSGQLQSRIGN